MSSWLSGGFNQLTDQITSFTKEVLTETTEEVTDPVAELEVLRRKYGELQNSQEYQKTEYEKLKLHCGELKDRADTAECQIATISQEYRKLLEGRDTEIRRLKTSNETLREQVAGLGTASPLRQLALGGQEQGRTGKGEGGAYESVDLGSAMDWGGLHYDDSFSSPLDPRAELDTLRHEIASLKARLQQSQSQLKSEQEDHAHDIARLEVAHHNNVEALNKQQQKVVNQLQVQLQQQQQQQETLEDQPQTKQQQQQVQAAPLTCSKDQRIQELEEMNRVMMLELQHIRARQTAGDDHGSVATGNQASQESVSLKEELAQMRENQEQSQQIVTRLQMERATIEAELEGIREELVHERRLVSGLEEDRTQLQVQVKTLQDELRQAEQNNQEVGVTSSQPQDMETISRLQHEVECVREERDDAMLKMSNAVLQAQQNAEAMKNLQTALEHLQRDQSSELGEALKRSQLELAECKSENSRVHAQYEGVCQELQEARTAAEAAALVSQELEVRDVLVGQLRERVVTLQKELETCHEASRQTQCTGVDRSLMKNLVLGYVQAPDPKKVEVLRLIAKILDFSHAELDQACASPSKGWLGGLWGRNTGGGGGASGTEKSPESFSRMFVDFLEAESSPTSIAPPTVNPSDSGYVNPLTDPDRPSLSTVSLLSSAPNTQSRLQQHDIRNSKSNSPPTSSDQSKTNTSTGPVMSTHNSNHFQSSLLQNVLNH